MIMLRPHSTDSIKWSRLAASLSPTVSVQRYSMRWYDSLHWCTRTTCARRVAKNDSPPSDPSAVCCGSPCGAPLGPFISYSVVLMVWKFLPSPHIEFTFSTLILLNIDFIQTLAEHFCCFCCMFLYPMMMKSFIHSTQVGSTHTQIERTDFFGVSYASVTFVPK